MHWDDDLTGPAHDIAAIDASPMRVTAGPGTGKTFAMMRRTARLLQMDRVEPKRILVCTFTRTAARDLQKSLASLGVAGVDEVRAGTLHSLCFSVLSREEVLEATGRTPRPLLASEERFLEEDLKGSPFGGIRECRKLIKAFNAAWARLQTDDPGWPQSSKDRKFQAALDRWLRFHQAMLIGELVPETLHYLRSNPLSPLRTAFDEVLVDEYQDLNRAEQALLDLLAENGRLTIIGDEDQSIYSFKHAHPQGISTFDESHPGTHDEKLEECRRCPQLVVHLANSLIRSNTSREDRELIPRPTNPAGEVHIVQWDTMNAEAEGLAAFIQARTQSGEVAAGDVLVLVPRRKIGYAIRDALEAAGTAAHSFFQEEALEGNPKKLDESKAQQSFTLLQLLVDPDDRVALRCWCGYGSPSLRSGAWKRLWAHCEQAGGSPREALERLADGQLSLPHTTDLVERYRELRGWLEGLAQLEIPDLVDTLFPDEEWAADLRELALAAIEEDSDEELDASRLLETLRVDITRPELPVDVDYVRVMSLHKSKGLTAQLVIVAGCIQGLIPFLEPDLTPAERHQRLEEQRRLFYVAITRPTKTLVLSSATRVLRSEAFAMLMEVRSGPGQWAQTVPSQFFRELGPRQPQPISGDGLI